MTPDKLRLTKSFTSYVERSDRVIKVAESFGIGLENRAWTVFENLELSITQGDVIYITGQSGSGKSCLLREIGLALTNVGKKVAVMDEVQMLDKPIIDQIGKTMTEATQLLALAGISDAYLFIRKPEELSDGQRYRFRLAKLLESDADVWIADEFGAVLDRVTAKVVSYNCQKIARNHKKTLILATTHVDLIGELGPTLLIQKRFKERIDVTGPYNVDVRNPG
jgi:hypothetical protein